MRLPAAITTEAALRDRVEQLSEQEQQVYSQARQIHDLNKDFQVSIYKYHQVSTIDDPIFFNDCSIISHPKIPEICTKVMMMAVTAAVALYDDIQRKNADLQINMSEAGL